MNRINPIKNLHILLFVIVAAAMLSVSCGSHNEDPYRIAGAIDSLLCSEFPADAPGAVAVVALGDTVIYNRSFGLARLDNGAPMTDSTLVNVASSTKTFTAVAMLRLVELGRISLDNKITDYYPNLPKKVYGAVTLRHILAQTSGIPDFRPRTADDWTRYVTGNRSMFGSVPDFLAYGREAEFTRFLEKVDSLSFEPGTSFERQDPPYMLLASVIEEASGMPFNTFMRDYIFAPAGIKQFFYAGNDPLGNNEAHAYRRTPAGSRNKVFHSSDGKWEEYDYGEAPFFLTKADRGLYISARDFVKFYIALARGKVLGSDIRENLLIPLTGTGRPGVSYSLGMNVAQDINGITRLYHRSKRGGFAAAEAIYPDRNLCYVILSNRDDWDMDRTAGALEQILFDKGVMHPTPPLITKAD